MNDLEAKIADYYRGFREAFRAENFPDLFAQIANYNQDLAPDAHRLGSFAILYTPVRRRPDIMIIANNPSWFDKYDFDTAEEIVRELMNGPPRVVSYVDHNHVFAHRLQDAFRRLNRIDLLETCVGMNRLWSRLAQKTPLGTRPAAQGATNWVSALSSIVREKVLRLLS